MGAQGGREAKAKIDKVVLDFACGASPLTMSTVFL